MNSLRFIFRQFWQNRLFTTLSILGLAIGISASWIIFSIVDYEFSYDKKIPDVDRIYQVVSKSKSDARIYQLASKSQSTDEEGGLSGVDKAVVNVMLNDAPGIALLVPIFHQSYESASVLDENGNKKTFANPSVLAETLPAYFDLMPHAWLSGDKKTALTAPGQLVLTKTKAHYYYPDLLPHQIIGKTITYNDTVHRQVVGVVDDLNFLNSISTNDGEFSTMNKADLHRESWGSIQQGNLLFFKVAKHANPLQVIEPLNRIQKELNEANDNRESWNEILPLSEKHFSDISFNYRTRVADKNVVYGLILIGGFLLLLACINYINLSTALLPQRAKEIGVRKTLGSTSKNQFLRFFGETTVLTLMAMVFSLPITYFATRYFSPFLPEGMSAYFNYGQMVAFGIVLIILVSLISGIYPAYLSVKMDTLTILKGKTTKATSNSVLTFREGLIVFQFFIAQLFIIATLIINQQLNYSTHKDLGFDKDAIITVDIPYNVYNQEQHKNKHFVLLNQLQEIADLRGVAMGDRPMKEAGFAIMTHYSYPQEQGNLDQEMIIKYVDTAYLKLYNIKLIAGRNIRQSDTINEVVLTEKALSGFGFSNAEQAIGKMLVSPYSNKTFPIVGVTADFHQFGVQTDIRPTIFMPRGNSIYSLNIKLSPETQQWPNTIKAIEKAWNSVYPNATFAYKFYDQLIEQIYEKEKNTQTLVHAAMVITLLISCLGLFGLVILNAFARTKEIGIRKVLGASVPRIVAMLSLDLMKPVLIAFVIASPIGWWAMNKWLQDFAYRIDVPWWIFVLTGIATLTIALLSVSYQAVRAARANPVDSLRNE